jgi:hypothetical protein
MHGLWSRFDVVKELAWDMECSMRRRIESLNEQASKLKDIEDEDYRDHLSDTYSDEYFSYTTEWIPLIRESLLLSICSSFEYHLDRLSSSYGRACGSSFKLGDMKDRGLTRSRKFMIRLGVEEKAFGSAWQALGDIYKVRNRIAHAGSISDGETQKAIQAQSEVFEQGDVNDYSIKIKEDGIERVCELMQQALRDINNHLFAPTKKEETEQAAP